MPQKVRKTLTPPCVPCDRRKNGFGEGDFRIFVGERMLSRDGVISGVTLLDNRESVDFRIARLAASFDAPLSLFTGDSEGIPFGKWRETSMHMIVTNGI